MRVTLTGATGRIGRAVVDSLRGRGDEVTVLTRDPARARRTLQGVHAEAWSPTEEPAPAGALAGADAVVHLAGEDVGQRWTAPVRERIRASREIGTRNLVAGIAAAEPRPAVLVSASASGIYGSRGDEPVDESAPPGDDFLAQVCVAWEREALAARDHGLRVVLLRTGVVLDAQGGALAKMLLPFRLGVGGPIAGGEQFLPWIHLDDLVGLYLRAIDDGGWSGPVNASAPHPVTNRAFGKALGRVLHRPAVLPVPGLAIRALYGEMAQIVTTGVRMVPARAEALGFGFAHPEVEEALRDTLAR